MIIASDTECGAPTDATIAERIDYGPWGDVIRHDLTGPAGYVPIPFGFAGGLYEPATGLVRFGARDYDPAVGRWTAKDPILFNGGDPNLYGYVLGDPVNGIDVEGKSPATLAATLFCAATSAAAWYGINVGLDDIQRKIDKNNKRLAELSEIPNKKKDQECQDEIEQLNRDNADLVWEYGAGQFQSGTAIFTGVTCAILAAVIR